MPANEDIQAALANDEGNVRHVFVVGLPRTGTTLTRNILNRSSFIGLGGESHFFDSGPRLRRWQDTSVRRRLGIHKRLTTAGLSRAMDWIYKNPRQNFWGRIALAIPPDALRQALLATDGTERSVLDLAYAIHAHGRPIRGEKTPAHLYSVPTLLDWFPQARVIHTFRDPRAIFVSQRRKYDARDLWGPLSGIRKAGIIFDLYASLRIIVAWRHAVRLHRRYSRKYQSNYILLQYEQLVTEPLPNVKRLCAFVGVEFDAAMLDQRTINSNFEDAAPGEAFNPAAVSRWQTQLHPILRRWFALWCGRSLETFGYDPA